MKKRMRMIPKELTEDIKKSRERLRYNKPLVYAKLMNYLQAEKECQQTAMSLIDFAFNFECNFRCTHCCAEILRKLPSQRGMSVQDVKIVADQADQLGIFIFNLIGGEPLLWLPQFGDIIAAIGSNRFHISITTNGWMLTPGVANRLKEFGVDKVMISIDSGLGEEHDRFRNRPGSFERAIQAVRNTKAVGLRTMISAVVTHQNIHSEGLKRVFEISRELEVGLDLQCATVSGAWSGNLETLINEDDRKYLENLRNDYPLLRRDVWSVPGSVGGCPAATGSVYVMPSGDVTPCIFIHISFGNILKEPLAVIQKRMIGIKQFREFTPLCLAGEDRDFISNYLSKTFNDNEILPLDYRKITF